MAIGAAPLVAWRTRPPKIARTLAKKRSSASSKAFCISSGTASPRLIMSRTFTPSAIASSARLRSSGSIAWIAPWASV